MKFLGFVLFAVVAILTFSDQLGEWTVVLGVVVAGIAFALQEVLVSIAGWMSITLSGVFEPGDRIQIGELT